MNERTILRQFGWFGLRIKFGFNKNSHSIYWVLRVELRKEFPVERHTAQPAPAKPMMMTMHQMNKESHTAGKWRAEGCWWNHQQRRSTERVKISSTQEISRPTAERSPNSQTLPSTWKALFNVKQSPCRSLFARIVCLWFVVVWQTNRQSIEKGWCRINEENWKGCALHLQPLFYPLRLGAHTASGRSVSSLIRISAKGD